MSSIPAMTVEAYTSDEYKDTGNLIVFVYSVNKKLSSKNYEDSSGISYNFLKESKRDSQLGNIDQDYHYLKEFLVGMYKVKAEDFHYKPNLKSKQGVIDDIQGQLNKHTRGQYGAYLFVFLSFLDVETNVEANSERICLHDQNEAITVNEIWDSIKSHTNLTGKPKVFLVQADDERLLGVPQYAKGPVPESFITKIPQEADRITVMSTIPQPGSYKKFKNRQFKASNPGTEPRPSFLIKAFVEVMRENADRSDKKIDFLSQTVIINNKILQMIKQLKTDIEQEDKNDTRVDDRVGIQTVTSTLTKQLVFKERVQTGVKHE